MVGGDNDSLRSISVNVPGFQNILFGSTLRGDENIVINVDEDAAVLSVAQNESEDNVSSPSSTTPSISSLSSSPPSSSNSIAEENSEENENSDDVSANTENMANDHN